MKIVTWNVNGIRSLKKNISSVLKDFNSDVVCFQETKISRSQLPETIALVDGYTSYFSYPRKQSGYSGVATYCKDPYLPDDAEEGMSVTLSFHDTESTENISCPIDVEKFDSEGRVIITYHIIKYGNEVGRLAVINVYCPRVDPEKPERQSYKMQFCHLLEAKTKELCNMGCFVIIVGDMNIACSIIDHCDPGDENEFYSSEARLWLKKFLSLETSAADSSAMIDAFRKFYPDRKQAYTCWNVKTGARATNYGTRIDYIIISHKMLPLIKHCDLMADYEGSDHCPVFAEFECESIPEKNCRLPSICTRLWPEYTGQQQKLHSFLQNTCNVAADSVPLSEVGALVKTNSDKRSKRKISQKTIASFFKTNNAVKTDASSVSVKSTSSKLPKLELAEANLDSNFDSPLENYVTNEDNVISSSPRNSQAAEWKSLLKGPPKPPVCSGHRKECVLRTVKKKGPNYGRQFFMCPQPAGHASNPDANCNYFKWASCPKVSVLK